MRAARALAAGVILAIAPPDIAMAQPHEADLGQMLPGPNAAGARRIDFDICLPATAEEYAALGKNAILMLRASSKDAAALPLAAVYIGRGAERMMLRQIMLLRTTTDETSGWTVQHAFYLLPIRAMKQDGTLAADFHDEGEAVRLADFTARAELGPYAPAFARHDGEDMPGEPDQAVLTRVLAREYHDYLE